jgi:hypothetical protein
MKTKAIFGLAALFLFNSCDLTTNLTTQENILTKIRLCDNSYVGLLCFLNFSGKVENANSCTVCSIELCATLYNRQTKTRTIEKYVVPVPITAYGSATYSNKVFVGSKIDVENVRVVSAKRY